MFKNKITALLPAVALFLAACGGGGVVASSPATAISSKVVSILEGMDSIDPNLAAKTVPATGGGNTQHGGLEISFPRYALGTAIYLDEALLPPPQQTALVFDRADLAGESANALFFYKNYKDSAPIYAASRDEDPLGTLGLEINEWLALGGVKAGLKYAEFGVWYSDMTVEASALGLDSTKSFLGDGRIFVPNMDAQLNNITQNMAGLSFSGTTVGLAKASEAGTGNLLRVAPVEGTVNLQFTSESAFSALFDLNLVDLASGTLSPWVIYEFIGAFDAGLGMLQAGAVERRWRNEAGGDITSDFIIGDLNEAHPDGPSYLIGLLFGGASVEEIAGFYNIYAKPEYGKDYYVDIMGAFGTIRK